MKFTKRKSLSGSGIDLAPIVDVVFNLLIFFALTLNFAISSGIKVNLPKATGEIIEIKDVNINISRDGKVYFNDVLMNSTNSLKQEFQKIPDKDTLIIIRADSEAMHGPVVSTMDLAKNQGFSKIAIGVEPKQ
ncbi:MAG: biopolymer transporter ExbD [Candidatus Dadabacteria bacterium]|nr:biopolymer transporter ExbD [Candidatus Dadabacteria bacterium]MCY4262593.1 biopolymer transporter ExbD [Candidatus Dadabacteria bacterium]